MNIKRVIELYQYSESNRLLLLRGQENSAPLVLSPLVPKNLSICEPQLSVDPKYSWDRMHLPIRNLCNHFPYLRQSE